MDIKETLKERGTTHGDFSENSYIAQSLKRVMLEGVKYQQLSDVQQEALSMIAHKIGRIVSGNPNEPDHWRDLAGYATLVEERLE